MARADLDVAEEKVHAEPANGSGGRRGGADAATMGGLSILRIDGSP